MKSKSHRIKDNPDDMGRDQQQGIPEFLLTKKELAKRLRSSERKIEMDEAMPRIRWGRSVRYDWAEVVNHLKGNEEGGRA